MSASPADVTPGRTPNGANLAPPRRPRPPVDPLVKPKRRPLKPGQKGAGAAKSAPPKDRPRHLQVSELPTSTPNVYDVRGDLDLIPSGFSSAPVHPVVHDYPLVISKRALMEGLRHHVAKFSAKRGVDPRDEHEFTRPVRLQRRDARAPAPGVAQGSADPQNDPEERERRELEKAERTAKREIELSQIAPAATTASKRVNMSMKKTEKVYRHDQTDAKKAASQLRYEEALQWHLEDFDNKQSWVGNYEAALSSTHAYMAFKDKKFTLVPVEKWYKFTPKLHIKQMPLEDAEQKLSQKAKAPDWLLQRQEQDVKRKKEEFNRKVTSRLYVGKVSRDETELAGGSVKPENGDVDELDFDEDRFADDEENELFEGDQDEVKANEDRIKKDQLQANIFDLKDEKTYERADQLEKRARQAEKQHGKRVKKALMKREKNRIYDSDSEHPYSEDSDTTDSEAERAAQEEAKKEEAKKEEEKAKNGSGASSKNNTPSNRPGKHPERPNLKRSGSANASDMSGNESSRKKQKHQHSRLGTGANTPNGTASRSGSPGAPTSSQQDVLKKPSASRGADGVKRPRGGAGSASDGEGAGSGAEMSDGTRKKIKIMVRKTNSSNASPGGSRGGSPERDGGGSRARSPDASPPPLPSKAELRAAIPPEGITLKGLIEKLGKGSFQGGRKNELFNVVKTVSTFDKATKTLKPLLDKPGPAS